MGSSCSSLASSVASSMASIASTSASRLRRITSQLLNYHYSTRKVFLMCVCVLAGFALVRVEQLVARGGPRATHETQRWLASTSGPRLALGSAALVARPELLLYRRANEQSAEFARLLNVQVLVPYRAAHARALDTLLHAVNAFNRLQARWLRAHALSVCTALAPHAPNAPPEPLELCLADNSALVQHIVALLPQQLLGSEFLSSCSLVPVNPSTLVRTHIDNKLIKLLFCRPIVCVILLTTVNYSLYSIVLVLQCSVSRHRQI